MEKLLFRASKEISYKEYDNATLDFFNEIMWSIIWARKMGSLIICEAVRKKQAAVHSLQTSLSTSLKADEAFAWKV